MNIARINVCSVGKYRASKKYLATQKIICPRCGKYISEGAGKNDLDLIVISRFYTNAYHLKCYKEILSNRVINSKKELQQNSRRFKYFCKKYNDKILLEAL